LESGSAGDAAHDESMFALVESELFPTADMNDVGTRTTEVTRTTLEGRLNVDPVDTLERVPAETLEMNDRGQCTLASALHSGSGHARALQWHQLDVDKRARTRLKQHQPCVVWLTGLSGAGKSTIANLVERKLHEAGRHTFLLDGDNVRHGLNRDLGFSRSDRVENVRRIGEVSRLMVEAGLIVLVSLISPFREGRRRARQLHAPGEFLEVFVDAPLSVAEARDPKGLYRKARAGLLPDFSGIDSPYEPPDRPELQVDTVRFTPEDAADAVVAMMGRAGVFAPSRRETAACADAQGSVAATSADADGSAVGGTPIYLSSATCARR
jgi:adenylyl-sulfate kinase